MLSHVKRIVNFTKPGFRQIQSSCVRLSDEIQYEKGKLTPKEKPYKPNPILMGTYFHFEKWDTSIRGFRILASKLKHKFDRNDQMYDQKRVDFLGPDLAAAHFFVFRGGVVKFNGIDKPFDRPNYKHLPNSKNNAYLVEAISLHNFNLHFEGLDHFSNLHNLKALSFQGVERFDNWYLDRISSLVPSLEYLDISFCKKVDFNGLHCLYRLKNLKCLNVEGISDSLEFRLGCLTVESEKRDLVILGTIPRPNVKNAFD